jgi:hypothetical protein
MEIRTAAYLTDATGAIAGELIRDVLDIITASCENGLCRRKGP